MRVLPCSSAMGILIRLAVLVSIAVPTDASKVRKGKYYRRENDDEKAWSKRDLRRLASKGSKGGTGSSVSAEDYDGGGGKYHRKKRRTAGYGPCRERRKRRRRRRDLGLRFNKFEMTNDYYGRPVYLDWDDYPLSQDMAHKLGHYSTIESLVMPDDYEVHGACVEDYIYKVGGYPTFPSSYSGSPYWKELEEVVVVQELRRVGKIPDFFVLPELWEGWTAYEVAEAVHDEYPGTNHVELIKSLLARGMKMDHTCAPYRSRYDFIGEEVKLATMNTWSIGAVAAINFMAKHHVGRPRPEEINWLIYKGHLDAADGVPPDLVNRIRSQRLSGSTMFTAYMEGSPTHPAWPAMHSAASSASLWLAVIADLTEEQYCQVLRTDFAVAYARTVAGVHYPSDNIAGLNMGQEIIAEHLAEHLAWTYGGDPQCYQEKIDYLRFDWHTFDPRRCTVKYNYQH